MVILLYNQLYTVLNYKMDACFCILVKISTILHFIVTLLNLTSLLLEKIKVQYIIVASIPTTGYTQAPKQKKLRIGK